MFHTLDLSMTITVSGLLIFKSLDVCVCVGGGGGGGRGRGRQTAALTFASVFQSFIHSADM